LTYHDKALEIKPDFDYALYAKGHALDNLGRHEEGLELIGQSLELNPNYDHAWMAKAEALYRLGRLEEARDALNNALILNGEYEEAWVFRGKILEEMGNALEAERCYEEALQCFHASLELEPENAELHYHHGLLLEDLERTDEAIDAYAASAFRGHSADALIHLSALLLRVGRAADALVPAEEARSRYPTNPRSHVAAGRAAAGLNRSADAEAFFQKALDIDPASEARLELARVLHSVGKDDDGLAVLQGVETSDAEALLIRADIQRSLGRTDEALADDDAAIRVATEGRDLAYRHKGRLLLDLGRPKEAIAAFDAALGLHPKDAEAWYDAARACQAFGQEGRARKLLDEALRLDPDHVQARRLRSEGATAD
jgi:tetratricopeptide (TPR) repeat protein